MSWVGRPPVLGPGLPLTSSESLHVLARSAAQAPRDLRYPPKLHARSHPAVRLLPFLGSVARRSSGPVSSRVRFQGSAAHPNCRPRAPAAAPPFTSGARRVVRLGDVTLPMFQGCEGRPPVLGPVSHVGAVMRAQAHQHKFSAPTCVTTKVRSPTVGRGISIAPRRPALRTPTARLGLVFVWRPCARRCATPGRPRRNLKTHDSPVTARPSAREPRPARAPRPNSST